MALVQQAGRPGRGGSTPRRSRAFHHPLLQNERSRREVRERKQFHCCRWARTCQHSRRGGRGEHCRGVAWRRRASCHGVLLDGVAGLEMPFSLGSLSELRCRTHVDQRCNRGSLIAHERSKPRIFCGGAHLIPYGPSSCTALPSLSECAVAAWIVLEGPVMGDTSAIPKQVLRPILLGSCLAYGTEGSA